MCDLHRVDNIPKEKKSILRFKNLGAGLGDVIIRLLFFAVQICGARMYSSPPPKRFSAQDPKGPNVEEMRKRSMGPDNGLCTKKTTI